MLHIINIIIYRVHTSRYHFPIMHKCNKDISHVGLGKISEVEIDPESNIETGPAAEMRSIGVKATETPKQKHGRRNG